MPVKKFLRCFISRGPPRETEISPKMFEVEGICHTGNGRAVKANWG